jgi:hypothetical protein
MRNAQVRSCLFTITLALSPTLFAADATTRLFEHLSKGDCAPSSLSGVVWTITAGPVGTHGELNWGDELEFEQVKLESDFDRKSAFRVWKNGSLWPSAEGWSGSCVRDGSVSLYVITGKVRLDGCMHELAFGRLDHDDRLGRRVEVIFEHAEESHFCTAGHGDAVLHPGHSHGDD